ncbi:arginine/serine-rich protein PNISR-like isoform X2 [Xyrauchen texanus]|uniref:arginine/serine-rich protein PNISR-like isoform X2 n=1 Tax=Xyrauchen texanus TaxID=154827 RepID=UPI0022420812|nr:arginine/serine-rich protein PNISR-like isoform X2 [Xyrauchen texanus]
MWEQGGQPWPQWPLGSQQQWMQSFQHQQDPGQVDWAALAQAWIAQKESNGDQPNGQEMQNMEPAPHNNHGAFPGDLNFARGWQPEWGMHGQPPPLPPEQMWIPSGQGPMDVINPSEDSNSQDSLEFPGDPHHGGFPQNSHGFGGQPEPYPIGPVIVNQFDYQHGAAPTGTAYGPPSSGFHTPYWAEGPQNRRDRLPGFRPERPRSPNQLGLKPETPTLDAVKRRTLPAWIREGLEKMDRDKQRKLERERIEKERVELSNDEMDSDVVEEEGDEPRLPRKSKFDSDDEDGEDDVAGEEVFGRRQEFSGRASPVQEDQNEPEMTEEEKEFQLMLMTKTLLTEVLLEVTNEEILLVAKETHHKATKAPAKQLAQSSALASLTGLGGLGDYGSDESEDEERSAKGSDSSDTDDEELLHRIRLKQDAFRRKERELLQQQERLALEGQAEKDLASDRLSRERASYEEEQLDSKHKQEVREREAEPTIERRRSRSEPEVNEVKRAVLSKEHTVRNGGSASPSQSERRSRSSSSSSSSSRSSSSSSSSASSRSSSRSSSPRRKRRRSRSASYGARRRSRSCSSRRHQSERDKLKDRRRSSRDGSMDRSSHHRKRSRSRQRRSSRGHRSRSKERPKASRSQERRRSRERRRSQSRSTSRNRRKQKVPSKDRDRDRRKERSRSHEKDKKKERELDKKKDKQKGKEKEMVVREEDNGKSKRRERENTNSHSERFSRQDSKSSKKGSAKSSKKNSESDSSRSRSPSPEISKEKKSKKSKFSRSRSTERSHKSGKKASRKHKSKSRSRSTSPSRRKR